MLNRLTAISPVDGRYYKGVEALSDYFSEFALIRYRVRVEIEYYIGLYELGLPQLKGFATEAEAKNAIAELKNIYINFSCEDAEQVKEIEKTTNHDVKAVEYFIKKKFAELGIDSKYGEFVHFGLTSQDINNTAIPLSLYEAMKQVYLPKLNEVLAIMEKDAAEWADVAMLARTHGQPASPTRLGKEINV
ncbi:MAG: adenylosuccinate lyase, partial [Bacteroidales bacterium]|nr:adenylosuccinate lyase [Bacteroidales bacterium]